MSAMKTALRFVLVLAVSGCVTASKFKAEQGAAAEARVAAAKLSSELEASRAQTTAVQKGLGEALGRVEELSKSESDLKAAVTETEAKRASASDQVTSLQKSVADLQKTLEANKGELTRKVAELVKEKDAVQARLAGTEKSAAEAASAKERALSDMTRKADGLEAESSKLSGRVKDLESQLDALKKARAALEDEKAALQKQKDEEVAAVTKSYEDIAAGLKAEISAGEVTISNLKGKLTVNLVDRVLFDSGSAEVKPAGRKVLARVGELLNQVSDKDIRIEGHTDNVPISPELRARYASNWELSTARATAVARYLQDHASVDPKRLVAAGLGEWRPVAPNDKPDSRALNRRIEVILVPRD